MLFTSLQGRGMGVNTSGFQNWLKGQKVEFQGLKAKKAQKLKKRYTFYRVTLAEDSSQAVSRFAKKRLLSPLFCLYRSSGRGGVNILRSQGLFLIVPGVV